MSLIFGGGVQAAGEGIKATLQGVGSFAKDLREALTGEVSAEKKAELLQQAQEIEAAANQAQRDINLAEAKSASVFVAGWRPYIGWICGTAIGCYYIPQALTASALWTAQCVKAIQAAPSVLTVQLPPYPVIFGWEELMGLVLSLLGIGTLRTLEKVKGVQGRH